MPLKQLLLPYASLIKLMSRIALLINFFVLLSIHLEGQMRQIYVDNNEQNEIYKLSFYSPNEGYIAFGGWIGYTRDTGRTFIKKYITISNVNFNGYSVNLTFGFEINGVKAFSQNNLIVYGDYGLVPSILYSGDGGNTFKLIYHSQYNLMQLSTGITDIIFPQNNNIGYAIDADRIIKTTDQGLSWNTIYIAPGSFFDHLEAGDNNNVFALCTEYKTNKLIKTTNGGSSWVPVSLPPVASAKMRYASFLDANTGWLSMYDDDNNEYFYKTTNGAGSWILQNDLEATPFYCTKMKFIDSNTGYAISDFFTTYKTLNSGATWEPLPRDNSFSYLNYSHNDIQVSGNQLWVGGGHGFLELSTNAGGTPIPKAYFKIDTMGLYNTGTVNLLNYSRTGYSFKWILNGTQISTSYNTSYIHDINRTKDTLALIVSNGVTTDTAVQYQNFYPSVIITGFTPTSAGAGDIVTIKGINFEGTTSVSFGGTKAASFTVINSTTINATLASGASGVVSVVTSTGRGSLSGFTFLPPPTITSFTPVSATAGTIVTITGTNFTGVSKVDFAGIGATSFTVLSSTTITAVVPSGSSGAISLTTVGGSTSLAGFISLPTITSFTPLHGTEGTILHISGTSFTDGTAVSVGGVSVLSFKVNSPNDITAVVGAGASGNVTVTKAGGNSSLSGFTWFANPIITSFSPASGPVGTTVTITGTGFDPVSINNTVYFGGIKAVVTGGNNNSLTVTVPVGATFDPISVTANNLIGYSEKPFLVTFANGGSITAKSFATTTVINPGSSIGLRNVVLGDLDGDGKLDLIVSNYATLSNNNGVLLYRNTSTISTISFAPPVSISGLGYTEAATGDLDGDGKLDLAIIVDGAIATFINTSVPGTISFVPGTVLTARNSPTGIAIGDVDGDGKPDIVASHYPDVSTSVFRNTSEPGNLSFATRVDYPVLGGRNILLTDLDGDKKPELIIPNAVDNSISVLKNNSTKGNISFAAPVNFAGYSHSYMASADIDGDGKTDLVSGDHNGSKVAVLINTSTLGSITFAPVTELNATSNPSGLGVSDLDGDGKPDIATALSNYNLSVFKNTSITGKASFSPKIDHIPGSFPGDMLAIGDINGDGKNDVVVVSETQHSISIHLNNVQPEPFIQSFTPVLGIAGTSVTITGNNFSGVTSVSFGGVAAASFTVNSPTFITAVVGSGASGDVAVTNSYGTGIRPGYVFSNPPQITSVSPVLAPVGATVTITGNNFSTVPSDNIVYFGGVKAVVSSSTDHTIIVTVPKGAGHDPVTVTVNNLTSYSSQLFNVTFPNGNSSFTAASFAPRVDRDNGGWGTFSDLDGDGKLDLILARGASGIAVARNTSLVGTITFDPNLYFTTGGSETLGVTTGDLDGDGKPDVVSYNYNSSSISVALNKSTIGNISLSGVTNYFTGISTTRPIDAIINDIDGDGKPDIIVANYYSQTISVFKNLSIPGKLILDARIDYLLDGYPTGVTLRDVDADGKPDMIVSVNGPDVVTVFANISVPGTISFAAKVNFKAGSWPNAVAASDIDGDGKLDIVIPNIGSNTISFLRNLSTTGNISFAPKQDFASGDGPNSVSIGDLDGDGKPDIIEQNNYSDNTVSVFKNTSTPGVISMKPKFNYSLGGIPTLGSIQDIDGDGKPDMAIYLSGGTTSFFRNNAGSSVIQQLCANSSTTIASGISGTSFQWQQNTGSNFINIGDNTNFSGTSTGTLGLKNVPLSWNGFQYRCIVNTIDTSLTTTLKVMALPLANAGVDTSICAGSSVKLSASGGTTYSWAPITGLSNPGIANPVATPAVTTPYIVTVSDDNLCSAMDTIIITVNSPVSVTIKAPDSIICLGTTVTFTASVTNGGSNPHYQWSVNGINAGNDQNTFTSNNFKNNDTINAVFTSDLACVTNQKSVSNTIKIEVQDLDTPLITVNDKTFAIANPDAMAVYTWQRLNNSVWFDVAPLTTGTSYEAKLTGEYRAKAVKGPCVVYSSSTAITVIERSKASNNYGIYLFPNPTTDFITLDSIKLSEEWQTLEIVNTNGEHIVTTLNINNRTSISVDIKAFIKGTYFVILRRKDGKFTVLRFVKI